MANRRTYAHLAQLKAMLEGIDGAPDYPISVGGRVFLAPLVPESKVTLPYITIPIIDLPLNFPAVDDTHVTLEYTQAIYGFVAETKVKGATESTGLPAIFDLFDSITKAIQTDFKLGGTVFDSTPKSGRISAGLHDRRWCQVIYYLDIRLLHGPGDIGP